MQREEMVGNQQAQRPEDTRSLRSWGMRRTVVEKGSEKHQHGEIGKSL